MDPNAALREWRSKLSTRIERREFGAALAEWIDKGGFEPQWEAGERLKFATWCRNVLGAIPWRLCADAVR